jgi:hypothetical protein
MARRRETDEEIEKLVEQIRGCPRTSKVTHLPRSVKNPSDYLLAPIDGDPSTYPGLDPLDARCARAIDR